MARARHAAALLFALAPTTAMQASLAAVDAGKLSVALQPSEQSQLSDLSVSVAASILQRNGVVLLKNALQPEVVDEAASTRYYFRVALAHAVSKQHCKAAAKRGDVVVTLRKADPEDAWLTLASTEVAGNYF